MNRVKFLAEDGSIGKKKCARYSEAIRASPPTYGGILGYKAPSKLYVAKQSRRQQ
jgi:hypothetical protein